MLPQQDPGWLYGVFVTEPNISVEPLNRAFEETTATIMADPAVKSFDAMIEEANSSWAEYHIFLTPRAQRRETTSEVKDRLSRRQPDIWKGITPQLGAGHKFGCSHWQ